MAYYGNPYGMYQQNSNINMPAAPMQIQNNGFVSVRNEDEARNYPVAFGNSVTFKDENAPYIYTKTMGFSQLDTPKFERYKLIKEEACERPSILAENAPLDSEAISDTIDELKREIEAIWTEIEGIKNVATKKTTTSRREKDGND